MPRPLAMLALRISIVVAAWCLIGANQRVSAQVFAPGLDQAPQNTYPNEQYYFALEIYREGNLQDAFEAFEMALGRCRKDINGRWLDAIPVHAMLGECFYQAGDLPAAAEQAELALAIAANNRGWLSALEWQDVVSAAVRTPDQSSAWAAPNIPAIVPTTQRMKLATGNPNIEAQIRAGGVFENPRLTSMDAVEILRGLAIAAYRRRIIYGTLADQSGIASQALDGTKFPAAFNQPIGTAIIGSVRSCEHFAGGSNEEAINDANRSAFVGGAIHPLTPITLLMSARVLAIGEQYKQAIPIAIQAAIAASALRQPELVGEAFMVAAGCANKDNAATIAVASAAASSMHMRQGRLAWVGSMLASAEAMLIMGDTVNAQAAISQVIAMLQRRDVQLPRMAAHGEYVTALAAAQTGDVAGQNSSAVIDAALARMYTFASGNGPVFRRANTAQRRAAGVAPAMPSLFQVALVNATAQGRGIGGKAVEEKLKHFSRPAPSSQWRWDPVDAIAWETFDRTPVINALIVSAIKRNDSTNLLTLVDSLARQRFLMTQPIGGRALQAHRLVAVDKALLTKDAADLLAAPTQPITQMINLKAAVSPGPGTAGFIAYASRLESLARWSALQRSETVGVAPPVVSATSDLARLPEGDGMLVFVDVAGNTLGIMAINQKLTIWNVAPTKAVGVEVSKILREIGVASNRAASRLDGESKWKRQAATLRRRLIPDEYLSSLENLKSLVIVPSGPLWYLPIGLLPMGDENAELLGDRIAIRFSPTPGCVLFPMAQSHLQRPIGVASGLFFAPRDGDENQRMIDEVKGSIKTMVSLPPDPPVASGLLGDGVGSIAVLAVSRAVAGDPFTFAPATYDAADPAGQLRFWMSSASQVPPSVFLFGYRSAAESPTLGDGSDLFLPLTAMHCSGVRDVVISRWAVGGESTSVIAKEFLQEVAFEGVQASWQRARQAIRSRGINPENEVILGSKDTQRDEVSGEHPLFWAGYLVDSPGS